MRNLKRALSLALATVMTLGLMVVGTGAVGYTDVTSEDNQEAIEVLQEVGIMTGVTDDEFNPDGLVTRNQMAVIMSQLLNLDYNYYRGINSFTDVPAWAAPYVAACVAEGVTAGIGDGLYGGEYNVTAAQAALMLMKALGYFQYQGDFTPDWQVATIRQGSYINLFDKVDANAEQALTRSQVAQMVLNALKANMVDFTGDVGTQLTLPDGTTYTAGYRAEYTARTNAANKYNSIDAGITNIAENDQYYVQLGEELYDGDLRLRSDASDSFGRPANNWRYDGRDIGTYTKDADLTYTAKVESGDIYSDLGLSRTVDADKVTVYLNGMEDDSLAIAIRRGSETKLGETGNGVLTQVYYDAEHNTALIAIIDTYVGTVVRTVAATDDRDAYIIVNPEDVNPGIGNEEFETTEAFDDDQYVLYTYSEYTEEIESVIPAIDVSGLVTRAENTDTDEADKAALTIDGNRYTKSENASGEELGAISVNEDYTVYTDAYGYLIYVERIDEIGDYALMYRVSNGSWNTSHKAYLVFADGSAALVDTEKDYSDAENLNYDYNGDDTVDSTDTSAWSTASSTFINNNTSVCSIRINTT